MQSLFGFDRASKIWVGSGLLLILTSSFVWLYVQNIQQPNDDNNIKSLTIHKVETKEKLFPATLGAMLNVVLPYQKTKERTAIESKHGVDFKAKSFITAHSKNWTIQLMRVSEEKVITSYLEKKSDHANFNYFKCIAPNKSESYILTYGNFANAQMAEGASKTYAFDLPKGVKPTPKRFDEYANEVSDSSGDERVIDRSGNKVRAVVLRYVSQRQMSVADARAEAKAQEQQQKQQQERQRNNSVKTALDTLSHQPVEVKNVPVDENMNVLDEKSTPNIESKVEQNSEINANEKVEIKKVQQLP